MYIAAIAPARMRGRLVSLNQLMIVIGISVSFFSNYFLLSLGDESWRWMLGVQVVPATVFFSAADPRAGESALAPQQGRELNALQVLTRPG